MNVTQEVESPDQGQYSFVAIAGDCASWDSDDAAVPAKTVRTVLKVLPRVSTRTYFAGEPAADVGAVHSYHTVASSDQPWA